MASLAESAWSTAGYARHKRVYVRLILDLLPKIRPYEEADFDDLIAETIRPGSDLATLLASKPGIGDAMEAHNEAVELEGHLRSAEEFECRGMSESPTLTDEDVIEGIADHKRFMEETRPDWDPTWKPGQHQ